MDTPTPNRERILEYLERVLSSESFKRAERSRTLLRFLVEQTLEGQSERLKEYTLGTEGLGRGESFDPRTDPIVRAEASRLRARLERYYETEGKHDPIVFLLPKGSYVPRFITPTRPSENQSVNASSRSVLFGRSRQAWLAILLLVVASFAVVLILNRLGAESSHAMLIFDVELRSAGMVGSEVGPDIVLSPDGGRLVFVSREPTGLAHLNSRSLDQPNSIRLPETDGARSPFFSPDGRWVGFIAGGKLKKTSVEGGSPVVLCDATDLFGASWEDESTIIAALNPTRKLWRIPSSGGSPQAILDLSAESVWPAWPQVLPDGRSMIYTVLTGLGADRGNIEAKALEGGERKLLVRGATFGRYLPGGYLTYINQGTLYAVQFDVNRLEVSGQAMPVIEDVSYSRTFGYAQFDVSRTGTLVYRKGGESERFVIDWLDRSDKTEPLLPHPGRYCWPRLSPDGRRIAYSASEGGAESVWVYDSKSDEARRLTTPADAYSSPMWMSDGHTILLGGSIGMSWVDADRPEQIQSVTTSQLVQVPWSVSSDGTLLAYYEMSPSRGFDLWTIPVKRDSAGFGVGHPEPLLQTPAFETYPSFSPDGKWLAYTSNESGAWEVYVRTYPDNGTKVKVSVVGGHVPKWSPNGHELLYRTIDQRIMVINYKIVNGTFVAGAPEAWSVRSLGDTGVLPNFDIAPDGNRLAVLMPVTRPEDQQSQNHVTFLLNFAENVKRRSTVGK